MKRLVSTCILLFLACLMTPLAHAGARLIVLPKYDHEVIVRKSNPDAERIVRDAILKSAAKFGWAIDRDDGKTMRMALVVRRKHEIVVDVRILGNAVAIDYVSSENMSYEKNGEISGLNADFCATMAAACAKNGQPVIHPNYAIWIRRLLAHARRVAVGAR